MRSVACSTGRSPVSTARPELARDGPRIPQPDTAVTIRRPLPACRQTLVRQSLSGCIGPQKSCACRCGRVSGFRQAVPRPTHRLNRPGGACCLLYSVRGEGLPRPADAGRVPLVRGAFPVSAGKKQPAGRFVCCAACRFASLFTGEKVSARSSGPFCRPWGRMPASGNRVSRFCLFPKRVFFARCPGRLPVGTLPGAALLAVTVSGECLRAGASLSCPRCSGTVACFWRKPVAGPEREARPYFVTPSQAVTSVLPFRRGFVRFCRAAIAPAGCFGKEIRVRQQSGRLESIARPAGCVHRRREGADRKTALAGMRGYGEGGGLFLCRERFPAGAGKRAGNGQDKAG